ncbi:MAG: class I SAM-dependent methyltransferase, partial [Actinomycetota bacterium]|nr:class I SAM-dependent methyltransferase [Actinomycetota bacterium]
DTDRDMPSSLSERAVREGVGNVVGLDAPPEDPDLPEPVDLIFLSNTYHHIPDPPRYFARTARYLRPAGRVAVIEAERKGLHRVFGHATPPEVIRSALQTAGYAVVVEHDFLPRQSFLLFEFSSPSPSDGWG